MQIVSINKDDFEAVIRDDADNPTKRTDFCEMAKRHELLIYDREHHQCLMICPPPGVDIVPENITNYYAPVLMSYNGIAEYLHVSASEALYYLHKIEIKPIVEINEFSHDGIYLQKAFDDRMREFTKTSGITFQEAQLQLGITEESMDVVKHFMTYHETGKVLRGIVESFFKCYLCSKTIYTTRASAVEDFVHNFNNAHPDLHIEIQYCNDCPEDNRQPASSRCYHCGKYLCSQHANWVEPITATLSPPKKICHNCQCSGDRRSE